MCDNDEALGLARHVREGVRCEDAGAIVKIGYANRVWKNSAGYLHIESVTLGDVFRWIEEDYGEDGLTKAETIRLEEIDDEKRTVLLRENFPRYADRLAALSSLKACISSGAEI